VAISPPSSTARRAGFSHRNGPAVDGELSFERLRLDAIDLIDALRSRLGATKVILAASSVGSAFGLLLAASRLDLLHAYVGTASTLLSQSRARSRMGAPSTISVAQATAKPSAC
jgi:pimeloyl-ACP methyl ester carboxylesterase